MIFFALLAGVLVGSSRSVNGRLALTTSALMASFWNHAVGFGALVLAGLAGFSLWPEGVGAIPLWAWVGGPLGVVFIASGSWLVARLGAVVTAMMVIAGQMVSGVVIDLIRGLPGSGMMRLAGVLLIIAGMVIAQGRKR
ncbi:EamA-like transporter family protein [Xinfangfangia sp. D13-10-4-6]|nr:EamA-like transporter family protein [Pseudogemmobacter hezensis]